MAKHLVPKPEQNTAPSSATKVTRRNGVRGKLQELPNMPWDILYEIFSCLHPLDLLRLARTTKDFRTFLMRKSASPFWKAALKNIDGLPECPEDLSEPAYTHLLFSNYCDVCLKTVRQGYDIDWRLRLHTCKRCSSFVYENEGFTRLMFPSLSYTELYERMGDFDGYVQRDMLSYPMEGFEELVTLDKRVVRFDATHYNKFLTGWDVLTDEKRDEFIMLHKSRIAAVREHARRCDQWWAAAHIGRTIELKELKQLRLSSIVEKLREIGWGEELDSLEQDDYRRLRRLAFVNQAKELTTRGWNNGQSKVIDFLEGYKEERLRGLKNQMIERRLRTLGVHVFEIQPSDCIFPPVREIAHMNAIREVIDVPYDIDVSRQTFESLTPAILEYAEGWKKTLKENFRINLKSAMNFIGITKIPPNVDLLDLAVGTFWECSRCTILPYPDILAHGCHRPRWTWARRDTYEGLVEENLGLIRDILDCSTLNALVKNAQVVIEALGEDPSSVTALELDRLPTRLVCTACSEPGKRRMMTWRMATEHLIHRRCCKDTAQEPNKFVQATPVELELCKKLEADSPAGKAEEQKRCYAPSVACPLCCMYAMSHSAMVDHMKRIHNVEDPEEKLYRLNHCRRRNISTVYNEETYMVIEDAASDPEV